MAIVFKTNKSALNTTSGAIQVKNGDNLQAKEVTINEEGEFTIKADSGYYGLSQVDISVDVPSDVHNQNVSVSPETTQQVVTPEEGYTGLGEVTVEAVTSSIDNNIAAGNIKKDVTILGVTGSYDPQPNLSNLNITPSTNAQEYNPAISGVDGYSLVRVSAVTSAIDQNIVAGNIKSGVTILGVQGTVNEGINPSGNINITDTNSTDVTNYATAQVVDANLAAGNIKNGVTILGVQGTYNPAPPQPSAYKGEFDGDMVGTLSFEPEPMEGDYFSSVEVTIPTMVLGTPAQPFDNGFLETLYNDEPDYTEAYYAMYAILSGQIDPQTGCYVAEDGNDTIYIEPYMENPDYDGTNAEYIFPEGFDLVDKDIVVRYDPAEMTITQGGVDPDYTYSAVISSASLDAINMNRNPETWLIEGISASTRSLSLSTNELKQMSISVSEPWEIQIGPIDEPEEEYNDGNRSLAKGAFKGALRGVGDEDSGEALEIDQMSGDAGVYTLNIISKEDQDTEFSIVGLNSGKSLRVTANSLGNYFKITSLEDGNVITWHSFDEDHPLEYSTDNGETWEFTTLTSSGGSYVCDLNADQDDEILFRGTNEYFANSPNGQDFCYFTSTKTVNVSGYLCSLLDSVNFVNYFLSVPYTFKAFFEGLKVVSAANLILPNNVTEGCYYSMFHNASTLQAAPALPAMTLAPNCYDDMFSYSGLVDAPALPAISLADYCYNAMFQHCWYLENAPELPAKYLTTGCYQYMFESCNALTATPVLPAAQLKAISYSHMFAYCSNLEEVTCLATNISASNSTNSWLDGVAASGMFYKSEDMSSWTTGTSGIPSGWTTEDYVEPAEEEELIGE